MLILLLSLPLAMAQECSTCGFYHPSEAEAHADAVVVARVTGCQCSALPGSGSLETVFTLAVEAVEKGKSAAHACTPGGALAGTVQEDSRSQNLRAGQRYRLFLDDQKNIVSAEALDDPDGGANGGTGSVTPSGFLDGGTGVPARFTLPDQGQPLHYVVDADALPAGITEEQALQAVEDALAAWAGATELSFVFDGLSSFGVSARDVTHNKDQRLYIQLHDLYDEIAAASTLGIGGRGATIPSYAPTGGGGTVGGLDFHQTTYGYVVMHHTSSSNENLVTFTEVLTHEIGHALGLAHSSTNSSEPDPVKAEAIMYYQAHNDGRGATLGTYDTNCIRVGYPNTGFVPFSSNRTFFSADTTVTPGLNQFSLLPRDLEDPPSSLTIQVISSTSGSGTYSFAGDVMTFSLGGNFATQALNDSQILNGSYFDRVIFRVTDGTHTSPYYIVRRIGNVDPPGDPSLVTPTLLSSPDFDLSWDTELYHTYEVQTSQDGQTWATRRLSWASATSDASSVYRSPDLDHRFVRVIAWP